jgi:gliding motility-associatede transport system auxiliary component
MKASARLQAQVLIQNGVFAVLLVAAALLLLWVTKDITMQWDLTQGKRNTLAKATLEVLNRMKGPVTVTAYATARDAVLGDVRQQISEFIGPYQRAKPDLTLKFVDPNLNPNETRAANVRINGEMVVQYGKLTEHLTTANEQAMANLLQRLLRGQERLVMYVTGHGEPALEGQKNFDLANFGEQLTNKGFRVAPLNLAVAQDVPDNVNVLVLTAPGASWQSGEVAKVKSYLVRGGNLLWLIDQAPLRGLEPIAEYLGLMLTPGIVIDPAAKGLGGQATTAIGYAYGIHPITENFAYNTAFPFVRQIGTKPDNGDWHTTQLVQVAQRGWVATGKLDKEELRFDKQRDVPGPITIAIALERNVKDKDQRVVVFGGSSFLANMYIGNETNLDLGVNVMNWLAQDENLITVQPRSGVDSQLHLTQGMVNLITLGFLVLLPAAFLFVGGMVWWRRRKA